MKTQNPYATNTGGKIDAIHKVADPSRATKEKGEDLRCGRNGKTTGKKEN